MIRASVPVVGYLSFLASNSAIANDFTALRDHLHPITQYNTSIPTNSITSKQTPSQKTKKKKKKGKPNSLGSFLSGGNSLWFSAIVKSEASETTAWSPELWRI